MQLMAPKSSILLVWLLAFTVLEIFFSPPVSSASPRPMEGFIKLEEGCLNHPEDVSVHNNVLYTATQNGWVKKIILKNETLVNWKHIESNTFLGITTTKEGNVIVCDTEKGLLEVSEEGVKVLDPHVKFTNDVIEASDGSLYFSVSSTKYKPNEFYKDLVEGVPHGQLLKYDRELNKSIVLHKGLYFANGVALSQDEDFVVVCESWKFRCRRYWLNGNHNGQLESYIDNLPGGPDNINLAPDGNFWIAIIDINHCGVSSFQRCEDKNQLLDAYPQIINLLVPLGKDSAARVVKVNTHGKIIMDYRDPNATYTSVVTSAVEFEGNLYMAGINNNFIGKLPLDAPKLATI